MELRRVWVLGPANNSLRKKQLARRTMQWDGHLVSSVHVVLHGVESSPNFARQASEVSQALASVSLSMDAARLCNLAHRDRERCSHGCAQYTQRYRTQCPNTPDLRVPTLSSILLGILSLSVATPDLIGWGCCLYRFLGTQTIQSILGVLAYMGSRRMAGNIRSCSSCLVPLACTEVSFVFLMLRCRLAYIYTNPTLLVVCTPLFSFLRCIHHPFTLMSSVYVIVWNIVNFVLQYIWDTKLPIEPMSCGETSPV